MKFNVSDNKIYGAGAKALAESLRGNQVMTDLNFANNSLSWIDENHKGLDGVIAISNAIPTMGALVKIDISENMLCAPGTKSIAVALNDNQVMTELNISGNYMGWKDYDSEAPDMSGVIAISNAIPTMGALASLDLSQNSIPAEEMGPIERLCESKQIALRK